MSELIFNRTILEKNNRILMAACAVMFLANFLLVFGILRLCQRPPLIVYTEDGQIAVLKTKTFKVNEALLTDFARIIAAQFLSFAADSLPKQIEGLRSYLGAKPIETMLASYKDNQTIIKKDNISQQFIVDHIEITKKTNPFWVEIQGMRNIHAAGNDKTVKMTYVMEVKKVKATEGNPYGLIMDDIIEKDKLFKKGKKT